MSLIFVMSDPFTVLTFLDLCDFLSPSMTSLFSPFSMMSSSFPGEPRASVDFDEGGTGGGFSPGIVFLLSGSSTTSAFVVVVVGIAHGDGARPHPTVAIQCGRSYAKPFRRRVQPCHMRTVSDGDDLVCLGIACGSSTTDRGKLMWFVVSGLRRKHRPQRRGSHELGKLATVHSGRDCFFNLQSQAALQTAYAWRGNRSVLSP